MNITVVKKELSLRFDLILSAPDNPIVLVNRIAGYCTYIYKNELLRNFLKAIQVDAKLAYKQYLKTYVMLKDYWNNRCENIQELAEKNRFTEECGGASYLIPLSEDFPLFDPLIPEQLQTLDLIAEYLINMVDDKTLEDINEFRTRSKRLSRQLQNERYKFEALCEIEVWGAYLNLRTITDMVLYTSVADEFIGNTYDDLNVKYWSEYSDFKKGEDWKGEKPVALALQKDFLIPKIMLLNNYLINELENPENINLIKKTAEVIPKGWELFEEIGSGNAVIKHNEKNYYTFSRSYSDKFHYFKKLWNNVGRKVSFEELYTAKGLLDYPKIKGVMSRENSKIRDTLSKLRQEFVKKNIPIKIIEEKGWFLRFI